MSTDLEVFEHAINWLKKNENYKPDYIVDLRAPEPIRSIKKIKEAINIILRKKNFDSLRSMNESKSSPDMMFQITNGRYKNIISRKLPSILKNLVNLKNKKYFWQNGYVDIIKTETILKKKSMCGTKVIPFITKEKTYTIDYKDDLEKISKILKPYKKMLA